MTSSLYQHVRRFFIFSLFSLSPLSLSTYLLSLTLFSLTLSLSLSLYFNRLIDRSIYLFFSDILFNLLKNNNFPFISFAPHRLFITYSFTSLSLSLSLTHTHTHTHTLFLSPFFPLIKDGYRAFSIRRNYGIKDRAKCVVTACYILPAMINVHGNMCLLHDGWPFVSKVTSTFDSPLIGCLTYVDI